MVRNRGTQLWQTPSERPCTSGNNTSIYTGQLEMYWCKMYSDSSKEMTGLIYSRRKGIGGSRGGGGGLGCAIDMKT